MFSAATIRAMSDRAAREASHAHRAPRVLYDAASVAHDLQGLPFLGDYCPRSWVPLTWHETGFVRGEAGSLWPDQQEPDEPVELFVDSSGFGSETEPALTRGQTVQRVAALLEAVKGTGWTLGAAISEAGQFQCYVRLYRRLPRGSK
jgi:hypothetical protein